MKKVNLFLVHTPFQLFIAEHMLREMAYFEEGASYLLLDMSSSNEPSIEYWTKMHRIDPPVGIGFFGESARRVTCIAHNVLEIEFPEREVDVFLSNIDYPLGNSLYRYTTEKERISLMSYPEGIASVIPSDFGVSKRSKNVVKQLYGWATGYPYVDYQGDMAGLKQAKKVFTLFPEEVPVQSKKIVEIPQLHLNASTCPSNDCIVLGQPLGDFLSKSIHERIFWGMIERAHELGNSVFYKAHPREDSHFTQLAERAGVIPIEDSRIAEIIYTEKPVQYVISVFSSALLHLKALYGQRVTCIAFGADAALSRGPQKSGYIFQLRGLFEKYNIQMEAFSC